MKMFSWPSSQVHWYRDAIFCKSVDWYTDSTSIYCNYLKIKIISIYTESFLRNTVARQMTTLERNRSKDGYYLISPTSRAHSPSKHRRLSSLIERNLTMNDAAQGFNMPSPLRGTLSTKLGPAMHIRAQMGPSFSIQNVSSLFFISF